MAERYCPIVSPTWEEFQNFYDFIQKLEQDNPGVGMIKVIPPAQWRARKKGYDNVQLKLNTPIRQEVHGLAGIYQVLSISERPMTLAQYKRYAKTQELKSKSEDPRDLEYLFWKNIRYSPPVYAADSQIQYSLFDKNNSWNLGRLDSYLSQGVQNFNIPGVTSPYVYVGCWKSMFAWHKEDLDLCAINFLHFGKPKFWYSIRPQYAERFENFVKNHFSEPFTHCQEFLRHKSTIISPKVLKNVGIPIEKAVQREGEFIVLFPRTYHAGFNAGFNCAEAVNFATPSWVELGMQAKPCRCQSDNVTINFEQFFINLENLKRPVRGYRIKDKPAKRVRVE